MLRKTMSIWTVLTLFVSLLLLSATAATTASADTPREPTPKSFRLGRDDKGTGGADDIEDKPVEVWVPGLHKGDIEVVLGIGFMDLGATILEHDQIIYKFNTDATFWGDVQLNGQSAFAPTLRLGYHLTNGLGIEGWSGISLSEYTSTIVNRHMRLNKPDATIIDNPALTEFDSEHRSLLTIQTGINAVLYPLDMSDPTGRWHPFVTAGVGNIWYSMNSNYTNSAASSLDLNFGGGLRFLADKNISLRLDVVMHHNTLQWTPTDHFLVLNQGTTFVPLNEYSRQPDGSTTETPVESFGSQAMNLLQWSLGFQGSF